MNDAPLLVDVDIYLWFASMGLVIWAFLTVVCLLFLVEKDKK